MDKKEIIIPFLVIGFCTFIAIISYTEFLTHRKSEKWIARKLKIAGLLLTLTICTSTNGQEIINTSYDAVAIDSDIITIKEIGVESIDYDKLRQIKGNVSKRTAERFSFCLVNVYGTKVYSDNINATDGNFNNTDEDFIILMPDKLPQGQYQLVFYADSKNNQRKENEKSRFKISL